MYRARRGETNAARPGSGHKGMWARSGIAILVVATAVAALLFVQSAAAALSGGAGAGSSGDPHPSFSQSGADANVIGASSFAMRLGSERGRGQAADDCVVREKSEPRSFGSSPFGLPGEGPLWIYLRDRRKPRVAVRRWSVDPNANPGAVAETIPVRKLVAVRFDGKIGFWAAKLRIPAGEPSWLVARIAWPDPDDCAVGNDFVVAGVSFS